MIIDKSVILKWSGSIVSYYKNKGYKYTKRYDEFEVNIKDLNPNSNVKVHCVCDYCGKNTLVSYNKYLFNTKNHTEKYACSKCRHKKMVEYNSGIHPNSEKLKGKNKLSIDRVIEIVESKNNNKLLNSKEYIGIEVKNLRVICGSCGNEFISSLSSIINGGGRCGKCGREKFLGSICHSKEFVENYINSINNNKLLNPDDYINTNTNNLKVKCGECGNIHTTSFSRYIYKKQKMCKECVNKIKINDIADKNRLTQEQVKSIIESKNNNILLNPEEYIKNSKINLKIKCGECGRIYTSSLVNYQSGQICCHHCSHKKTRGERLLEECLEKLNIEFESQKRFDGCKDKRTLPFDDYLPEYNTCIEFDGAQHYEPIFGKESFKKTKLHDEIKNAFCKENNVNLIRIPYWESQNIEQILRKELNI